MKQVDAYKVVWDVRANKGTLLLHTLPEGVEQVLMDNPEEASLLLDILRNEEPVFFHQGVIFTGFEPTGEGENA